MVKEGGWRCTLTLQNAASRELKGLERLRKDVGSILWVFAEKHRPFRDH